MCFINKLHSNACVLFINLVQHVVPHLKVVWNNFCGLLLLIQVQFRFIHH